MDHIRQAVTKARDRRIGANSRPQSGSAAPVHRGSIDFNSLVKSACNFEAFAENRIISNEHDTVLNAYRVLRTRVLQRMESEGWKSVAIVSPAPSAGKTVTAINLAIAVSSSETSRSTLLDFDFYRPSVARYLGLENPGSVLDYFENEKEFTEIARRTDLPNFTVLANERVSRRGAEFLSSTAVEGLIDTAVRGLGSRIVVMDTSPILGCDDTLALLPQVDCVLLVAASGGTKAADIKEAKRLLRNTNIVGTVLNMAPSSSVKSGYYYY